MNVSAADLCLIVSPISERVYSHPIHALHYFPVRAGTQAMNQRCTGYDTLQKFIGVGYMEALQIQLDDVSGADYTTGFNIFYCPLIEQGATLQFNTTTQSWSDVVDGSGPRSNPVMNNPHWLADILNGKPLLFPSASSQG